MKTNFPAMFYLKTYTRQMFFNFISARSHVETRLLINLQITMGGLLKRGLLTSGRLVTWYAPRITNKHWINTQMLLYLNSIINLSWKKSLIKMSCRQHVVDTSCQAITRSLISYLILSNNKQRRKFLLK